MQTTTYQPIVTRPCLDNTREYTPCLFSHLISGDATGGEAALIYFLGQKGGEPPYHLHTREDEFFYILEGEAIYESGGRQLLARAGSLIWFPKDTEHAFRFTTPTARGLIGFFPAMFEKWFIEFSEPARSMELPDASATNYSVDIPKMMAMAAECGVQFLPPTTEATVPSEVALSEGFSAHRDDASSIEFPFCGIRFLATSEQTAGKLTVIECDVHLGQSIPLHTKPCLDISYVLEGELRYQLGDQFYDVRAGDCIACPAGVPFGFRNIGTGNARTLDMMFGCPFEIFIDRLAVLNPETEKEAMLALFEEYGMTFLGSEIAG
ncbi:MAG: cupin domain-containing protein [Armatimonadetes bacterium]|nr:cupin domain-containing protein [Armatimonadota bacterium]